MSDFYQQIANQNAEIKAVIKQEAEKSKVDLQFEAINVITAEVVSVSINSVFPDPVEQKGTNKGHTQY